MCGGGSQRDAILCSVGANAAHGLLRTNDDKCRAVMVLLNDPEWSGWSDREVARQCAVHHRTVAKLRGDVTGDLSSEPRSYTTKHGATAKMNTAKIGKSKGKASKPAAPPAEDDEPTAAEADGDEAHDSASTEKPGDASEPADPHAKARRGLSNLTRVGLEDEVIGLREENAQLLREGQKNDGHRKDEQYCTVDPVRLGAAAPPGNHDGDRGDHMALDLHCHKSPVGPDPVQLDFPDDEHNDDVADPSLHGALHLRAAPQKVPGIAGLNLIPRHLRVKGRCKG